MITLAMVANNSGTAYLAVTEREELTPWPDLTERFATTISTLSVAGALSVTQRVVLDPNAYRTAMAQVFRSGTQYLQSNMSSLIVDDVILLDSGVLVIVGRLRFYFDYGGGSPLGVEELPGLFGISPSNGSLLWSLHGKMYNPEPYEIAEVRANIADDRFLLWVLRSSSGLSSTEIDGELFEGRVPTSGDHLPAREVFSAVNDYKLVDYAVGPDDSIYVVVRDESPLACFDTPLTNYELRIFNKDFTGELAAATPLDLDYDPRFYHHSYGSFGNPRMQSQRRVFVEPDGNDVRVVLHGSVWPDKKTERALYKGSAAYPYPAFGDGCPADIINNYCCDDPRVASRNPGVCTGVPDKGACPCQGVDPAQQQCGIRYTYNIEACDRPHSAFAVEHIVLRRSSGPLSWTHDEQRHTVAAAPEGGFYGGLDAAGAFVEPLTLTSDGKGRVTYVGASGVRVIRLDDPDNPDVEIPSPTWASPGSVLTDRAATPRSIHGSLSSLRVFQHNPALGVNIEESWAWPIRSYSDPSLILPVGNGRLIRFSGSISSNLTVRLYEPSNSWVGPVFKDHNSPAQNLTPCLDSASNCGTQYSFFSSTIGSGRTTRFVDDGHPTPSVTIAFWTNGIM